MNVERRLIEFAVDFILRGVAMKNCVIDANTDKLTAYEVMQKVQHEGKMPREWYELKGLLDDIEKKEKSLD